MKKNFLSTLVIIATLFSLPCISSETEKKEHKKDLFLGIPQRLIQSLKSRRPPVEEEREAMRSMLVRRSRSTTSLLAGSNAAGDTDRYLTDLSNIEDWNIHGKDQQRSQQTDNN